SAGRRSFEETLSVVIVPAYQISRKARMKGAEQEQAVIDEWLDANFILLDDLGTGPDTFYSRQLVQEVLDGRDFRDSFGLVVTSKYSLDGLAHKLSDDAIPSRLAGLCQVIEVKGPDRRLDRSRWADNDG